MTPDSDGLHKIANTENPERAADVVFVHGLGGGSHSTWRHGQAGTAGHFFWPEELGRNFPQWGIWSLGHASGISHWFADEGMALEDRANNFALKLANQHFGERPIIFVTHSMGGLVVKQFVTAASGLGGGDWKRIVDAVGGIVFLGTPHLGAHMATYAKGFAVLLRTQKHLKQMRFAGRQLDQLHTHFVKWRHEANCPVESYVETRGIARSGWVGIQRLLPRVQVVPDVSGDPKIPGCDCHRIEADHVALVKPTGRGHDVYAGVERFINSALRRAGADAPRTSGSVPEHHPAGNNSRLGSPAHPAHCPATEEPSPRSDLPSGLVTFMFTDIVNSTAMKRQLSQPTIAERDAAFLENIKEPHARIIKRCLEKRGGRIIEGTGDGYFIAFDNPQFGVLCGLEIQEALAKAAIQTPTGPLRIRIGLHTGPAKPQELAYTSSAADEAARVQSKAEGGLVFVSAATREHSRGIHGIVAHPAGSHDLKGIGAVELFLVLREGQPVPPGIVKVPPTGKDSRSLRDHSCQADLSRIGKYAPAELIGREEELKQLNDAWGKAVRDEPHRPRVLTFVALGGEGKTSLIAKWAVDLSDNNWPGCDAAFAWSFYIQGTCEQQASSSDLFLKEALTFFGDDADKAFAASPVGAFEKGQRLARLVGRRRSLLILDGLEPLQYAPASPTPGQLKDQGLAALLKGLAAASHSLCVVTTRYSLPDLRAFLGKTVREEKLTRLSREAGMVLLQRLSVRGTEAEAAQLVEDVRGHALTLNLLGSYLRDAHGGDIRKRDLVELADADAEQQGGHAFRVMDAYGKSFESEGEKGQRALALLRLLGLFDRPVTADCLQAIWSGAAIAGLTEPLLGLSDAQRNLTLKRLEDATLLTVQRDEATGLLTALDAHPLLREHFTRRLREEQPEAWHAAHRRLYEHLCASTREGDAPTLEDLQPLYQAVAHGCQAGLHQEACDKVYRDRIQRAGAHSERDNQTGAIGADLAAVACFFVEPWHQISPKLTDAAQGWLLNEAAFWLRSMGRLRESLEPLKAGLEMKVRLGDWENAVTNACNLSEHELAYGAIHQAVTTASQAVEHAVRAGNASKHSDALSGLADALHQAGRWDEAKTRFHEAEQAKRRIQPGCSLGDFRYCDLLLGAPERAAWQRILEWRANALDCARLSPFSEDVPGSVAPSMSTPESGGDAAHFRTLQEVRDRAPQKIDPAEHAKLPPHTVALAHLTQGRATLYEAILNCSKPRSSTLNTFMVDAAVTGLRRSGNLDDLPHGLLTRAWVRFLNGVRVGTDSAQEDLDEAWEIAERGPMKLLMADILLTRCRLFGIQKSTANGEKYPWKSPQADLEAATKLVNQCGYHRRDQELEDAKKALAVTRRP